MNIINTKIEKVDFKEMNLLEFGNNILMGGVIYSGNGNNYICLFPDDADIKEPFKAIDLSPEDWKKVIRQTDTMETEILEAAADGKMVKAIVRKSTRMIEQGLSWRVYKRDGYKCRYCAKEGIPMTVDHLVLWEKGGPSIEENLATSCRKCNKTRGSVLYEDWLNHPYYLKVSRGLSDKVKDLNESVLFTLDKIPLRTHTRKR